MITINEAKNLKYMTNTNHKLSLSGLADLQSTFGLHFYIDYVYNENLASKSNYNYNYNVELFSTYKTEYDNIMCNLNDYVTMNYVTEYKSIKCNNEFYSDYYYINRIVSFIKDNFNMDAGEFTSFDPNIY